MNFNSTIWKRITDKIKIDRESGCHIWIGAYSKKRNGKRPVIRLGGRGSPIVNVARFLLIQSTGIEPPKEIECGHICPNGENHKCVNVEHLKWMTRQENENYKKRHD